MAAPHIDPSTVWLLVPAYNEEQVICGVLDVVRPYGYQVVVVNDCSRDGTSDAVRSRPWVHLVEHPINMGQGAALQTGTSYALRRGAKYIVHFDGDGQHPIAQVNELLAPLAAGKADITLGTRFKPRRDGVTSNVPRAKRRLLAAATAYTRFVTGLRITDTHNGFRAMTAETARKLDLHQNRMAHASEILFWIAREKLRYREIAVTIQYTEYSISKGQSMFNALNILWDDLVHLLGR